MVSQKTQETLDISMEKRKKQEHGFSITAFRVVQEATEGTESKQKPAIDFKAFGKLGGLNGGKARVEKLSPERRVEIAKKAAQARWGK